LAQKHTKNARDAPIKLHMFLHATNIETRD